MAVNDPHNLQLIMHWVTILRWCAQNELSQKLTFGGKKGLLNVISIPNTSTTVPQKTPLSRGHNNIPDGLKNVLQQQCLLRGTDHNSVLYTTDTEVTETPTLKRFYMSSLKMIQFLFHNGKCL
jgi:hypothetical protein